MIQKRHKIKSSAGNAIPTAQVVIVRSLSLSCDSLCSSHVSVPKAIPTTMDAIFSYWNGLIGQMVRSLRNGEMDRFLRTGVFDISVARPAVTVTRWKLCRAIVSISVVFKLEEDPRITHVYESLGSTPFESDSPSWRK